MVDFRYHLVSLISVFLALAVGIVLGAGPLKEPITGTLTNEVEQLRTERNELRTELAQSQQEIGTLDAYLGEVSDQVLQGLLPHRKVAVVAVAAQNSTVLDSIQARLAQSGATVAASLQLTDAWWAAGRTDANDVLATTLRSQVSTLPRSSTTSTLVAALWFAMTDTGADGTASAKAKTVLAALGKAGLVDAAAVNAPVDAAVVYIDHSITEEATDETPATDSAAQISGLCTEMARAAALTTDGTVFGGPAATAADPTTVIRNSTALSSMVSTVDDITDVMGQLSVPRALAGDIEGRTGHFGTAGSDSPGRATDGLTPGFYPVPTPTAPATIQPPAAPTDQPANTEPAGSDADTGSGLDPAGDGQAGSDG